VCHLWVFADFHGCVLALYQIQEEGCVLALYQIQ